MKLLFYILLILCLTFNSNKPVDCAYKEMIELQEECGDHFDLFFHSFPVEILESQNKFQNYKENNKKEFDSIIDNSYHTMRMGFLYDIFDKSYMETIKKELDDVIRCQ